MSIFLSCQAPNCSARLMLNSLHSLDNKNKHNIAKAKEIFSKAAVIPIFSVLKYHQCMVVLFASFSFSFKSLCKRMC